MSTLSVSAIQNTASPVTNVVLNADGSSTVALYNAAVAPTPTQTGTLWYDASGTVTGDSTVLIWDGAAWVGTFGATAATLAEAAAGVLTTKYLSPETGVPKDAAGMTGAAILPSGTTAQRPAAPASGMVRVNTDTNPQLEQYANGTWQPIGVITSNLTLNVATTGNDTTGLGTAAAPWATPHKAMAYLSNYAIAQGVTVTVSVADGAYTFTTPLNLNHPDGDRIFINGGTTTGVRPTGAALNGGGVGNTPATEAFNDALLKAYYNTQWQFNGCNGLVCSTGGNVTVNTVLIRGDASSPWSGVVAGNYDASTYYASSGGINLGDTVAVHNFSDGGVVTRFGGSINAQSATVSNSGISGIVTNLGGSIWANNATSSNNYNSGIITNFGGSIYAASAIASNNSNYGIVTYFGGSIYAASAIASNNSNYGIATAYGGSIWAENATASNNGVTGILTNFGGSIRAYNATAPNNASHGIATNFGGSIWANNATATGNGSTDIFANKAGIILVNGATYGTISPALNTVGNLNAATSN